MIEKTELRKILCDELIELAKEDDRIVVLDADLCSSSGTGPFYAAFPERAFNVGIAEANMIGVAAGLAASGKIPFCNSFAAFAARRTYDQFTVSVAYSRLPVKVVGSDPGICAEINGGTHMAFEDMGIMRGLADVVCFEPTDGYMLKKAVREIALNNKPVYVRLFRKIPQLTIFDDSLDFKLGKAIEIRDGKDITLFASGIMVQRALEAADILDKEGIKAKVVNIHTWQPIDAETIVKAAKETGAAVVCENHSVHNGLCSAVSEVLVQNNPIPCEFIAIKERFGEVGKLPYLSEVFKLRTEDIVDAAKAALKRKQA
ncbi:MAG: transketolase family protein [Clostridiales bacterium]|nr:transketolase family protein [Clostridiales bacterium]